MKTSILAIVFAVGFAAIIVFLAVNFLPIIPTEKYDISVDPIMIMDEMGTETHVAIKNTGMNALTNVLVHYGGTANQIPYPYSILEKRYHSHHLTVAN